MQRLGRFALFAAEAAVALVVAYLVGTEVGSLEWYAVVAGVFIGLGVLQVLWLVLRREA
jgi:hypothetical protein